MKDIKTLKVLSISHVPLESNYGAGTSLRLHWRAMLPQLSAGLIEPHLITRIVLRDVIGGKNISKSIRGKPFFLHRNFILPFELNYERGNLTCVKEFRMKMSSVIHKAIFKIYAGRLIEVIELEKHDVVHLNSVVLAPVARAIKNRLGVRSPYIILHVREFLDNKISKKQISDICAADYFICIDVAAKKRFINTAGVTLTKRCSVINNPFFTPQNIIHGDVFVNDKTDIKRFAIAGGVTSDKGVLRVCEAFLGAEIPDAVLYIVGAGAGPYYEKVKNLVVGSNEKCRLLGELDQLSERGFYNSIDVLIRGDKSFRTGRTVYEALYAGASVVFPGSVSDLESDTELYRFKDQIYLFEPNSSQKLIEALVKASRFIIPSERTLRTHLDNFKQYRERMSQIYFAHRQSG